MPRRPYLCLDDYDCIGFDLDHTLCRYNIGPLVRLEYDLLADFLINKKGYDPSIRTRTVQDNADFICKGLTLDCERGNLIRLGIDGTVLTASHGTRRLTDFEIEKLYGRCRKKHVGTEFVQHLSEFGPQKLVEFNSLLHNFMDYFDIAAPLICTRIVDVLDQSQNRGKPLDEYTFWPDVQEGLKTMYMRTHFAIDEGGFFPAVKERPEEFVLQRRPEFREWLQMLRNNGKFLYVITGSHIDFASHVASHAIGSDWKDLFDIIIFFARKPSFFVEKRPFLKLDGAQEVETLETWEDLETRYSYSQGNWKDLNEFFEYCTEWEPTNSLYFGDNVLQDILAPKKFTATIDSVAVSEELLAEGTVGHPPSHPHADILTSSFWGSYFHCPRPARKTVAERTMPFRKMSEEPRNPIRNPTEMKRDIHLRRVASMKSPNDAPRPLPDIRATPKSVPHSREATPITAVNSTNVAAGGSNEELIELSGPLKINTLWGAMIRDNAKMCIPDLDILVDYPIDYRFPAFGKDKQGQVVGSGFFPADPLSLQPSTKSQQ